MSLVIAIKSPEGLVLAADSCLSLEINNNNQKFMTSFNNATKLFSFSAPHNHIGVLVYGLALIKGRTAQSYIPELELYFGPERLQNVKDYADKISDFFSIIWDKNMPLDYNGPEIMFLVAGFNENEAHGRIFNFAIPFHSSPKEKQDSPNAFGITWGGDVGIINRLLMGYDFVLINEVNALNITDEAKRNLVDNLNKKAKINLPFDIYSLQDCVDLSRFLIETTIKVKKFSLLPQNVDYPIDVAIIRRNENLVFINKKEVK